MKSIQKNEDKLSEEGLILKDLLTARTIYHNYSWEKLTIDFETVHQN